MALLSKYGQIFMYMVDRLTAFSEYLLIVYVIVFIYLAFALYRQIRRL